MENEKWEKILIVIYVKVVRLVRMNSFLALVEEATTLRPSEIKEC
jgi:hypothetical protein